MKKKAKIQKLAGETKKIEAGVYILQNLVKVKQSCEYWYNKNVT